MKTISIVSPCYNEEAGIKILNERLNDVMTSLSNFKFEVILIDDGSRDETWGKIKSIAAEDSRYLAIKLSRNYGHQLALSAGLRHASGDFIFIIDADLQDPPELLPKMLSVMREEKSDVVYGQRRKRPGETWFKLASAYMFYRTLNLLAGADIPRDTGDFRLMTGRALGVFLKMPEHHRFIRGMISWVGFKQTAFPYDRDSRNWGTTNYPLRKMIAFAINAITSFSIIPLRFASYVGFSLSALCFLFSGYVLFQKATGAAIQGWTSVMLGILFLGSIQLISIGILGEYLGRLFIESKNRPLFVIEEISGTSTTEVQRHPFDA